MKQKNGVLMHFQLILTQNHYLQWAVALHQHQIFHFPNYPLSCFHLMLRHQYFKLSCVSNLFLVTNLSNVSFQVTPKINCKQSLWAILLNEWQLMLCLVVITLSLQPRQVVNSSQPFSMSNMLHNTIVTKFISCACKWKGTYLLDLTSNHEDEGGQAVNSRVLCCPKFPPNKMVITLQDGARSNWSQQKLQRTFPR
jgi:hypothetical protein